MRFLQQYSSSGPDPLKGAPSQIGPVLPIHCCQGSETISQCRRKRHHCSNVFVTKFYLDCLIRQQLFWSICDEKCRPIFIYLFILMLVQFVVQSEPGNSGDHSKMSSEHINTHTHKHMIKFISQWDIFLIFMFRRCFPDKFSSHAFADSPTDLLLSPRLYRFNY